MIQFQINHSSTVFRVQARPFARSRKRAKREPKERQKGAGSEESRKRAKREPKERKKGAGSKESRNRAKREPKERKKGARSKESRKRAERESKESQKGAGSEESRQRAKRAPKGSRKQREPAGPTSTFFLSGRTPQLLKHGFTLNFAREFQTKGAGVGADHFMV